MENKYQKRAEKYNRLSKEANKQIRPVIYAKFILIITAIILAIVLYNAGLFIICLALIVAIFVGYFYLDKKHTQIIDYKTNTNMLANINSNALKRFNGEWRNFKDNGEDLNEPDHPYASDLDIIGKDSLFQWINMCGTPWGRRALAKTLLFPDEDSTEIIAKQDAIQELSKKVNFRQRLRLETSKLNANEEKFNELVNWAQIAQPFYRKTWVVALIRTLPVITLISIFLGPILNIIPIFIPFLLLFIQWVLLSIDKRRRSQYLLSIYRSNKSLKKLDGVLTILEKHKHSSMLLKSLRQKMFNVQNVLPSKQIKTLSTIASSVSNRNNMLYFLFNLALLWDYQCCVSLEKWKEKSGEYLKDWFEIIGAFESLSSISLIKFDHPDWATPSFEESSSHTIINAKEVGHPLLGRKSVTNSIQFNNTNPIALITGSNMSGKSTFLRTIGINLIHAYIGAPVYANEFSCQCMKLCTCMRVADDLQKNISSFYCEIIRIKMIIDQVKEGQKVFFLLDEIFKGTNSADRHTAAKTIIHNLNKNGASGMVSTHDLELDVLEKESNGEILNYHFEESYNEARINFDYKLKKGVSTTRNAIFLIRAAGIDM